jgi:hypothetical protein
MLGALVHSTRLVPTKHTRQLGLAVLRGPTIVLLSPLDGLEGTSSSILHNISSLFGTLVDLFRLVLSAWVLIEIENPFLAPES